MSRRLNQKLAKKRLKSVAENNGFSISGVRSWIRKRFPSKNRRKFVIPIICVIFVVSTFVLLNEVQLGTGNKEIIGNGSTLPSSVGDFAKVSNSITLFGDKIPFLYIGSEACPYCAAEGWSVYTALKSEGGAWSSVSFVNSNASDEFPDTPGINFASVVYSDSSLIFIGNEISDVNWKPLQSLNSTVSALFTKYDPQARIPFILIGGVYLHIGGSYSPDLLANMSGTAVMSALNANSAFCSKVINESLVIEHVINDIGNASDQPAIGRTISVESVELIASWRTLF